MSVRFSRLRAVLSVLAVAAMLTACTRAPEEPWESAQVLGVPPNGADMFQLNTLDSFKKYSRVKNFEIVGHSYLRGPWVNPAFSHVGMAINTMRICDNKTAFLAGYNPIVFGVLIVDVSNPADMKPLSFIPGHPGTKNTYLRVSCARNVLAFDHSGEQPNNLTGARPVQSNPSKPAPGARLLSGVSFYDVSDPRTPKLLGDWLNPGGLTHGMEMDDSYVYVCGTAAESKPEIQVEELNIINYDTPSKPTTAARFHITGQHKGENFSELNRKNPNGSDQMITCHEIQKDNDRLYVAYRDEGIVVLDITDPSKPKRIDGGFDYSPPFNGDPGLPREGCCPGAHTFMPAHHTSELPTIAVLTDEHFSCPPGFGRILDITYLDRITLLSTYHIRGVDDQYDFDKKKFICPEGSQESAHMAEFDHRLRDGNLFYQAWYNQGLRAIDISNPFAPREVGYYISPDFTIDVPGQKGRHTREPYPDWNSDLIYVTDGNGGGLTVLRYTGPLPTTPPIPALR
ncbi:MAG TPA: hypothetical protein VGB82_13825 [Alphaproteobacteria bacterium]